MNDASCGDAGGELTARSRTTNNNRDTQATQP